MKLKDLLQNITHKAIFGNPDIEIHNIQFDSRKVEFGDVFVAVRGSESDGHDYILAAIKNGAATVVCEQIPVIETPNSVFPSMNAENCFTSPDLDTVFILVENSAEALGVIASNFYGNPSENLILTGVTGTNGKTTTATLLYQIFQKLGFKVGLISTVCNYIDNEPIATEMTTPDQLSLNRLLAQMVAAGCQYAFMEVSSHAVVQRRIAGLRFCGAIFTNLTRDHLDFHGSMDAYRDAKKMFFDNLPKTAFALTNIDDKNGEFMLQNTKAQKFTYSTRTLADFKTKILEQDFNGTLISIEQNLKAQETKQFEIYTNFVGRFNAYNLTAVYAAAVLLMKKYESEKNNNYELETEILRILSTLQHVSGRFETIRSPQGYTAVVDYAHTPDALNNVISTINDILQQTGGHLITVVGCGGNRDKGKRPMMARLAVDNSWKAILTSDNPRKENPQDIINDMLAGLNNEQKRNSLSIVDRRQAIKTACSLAQKGDVVLIAGKGHENYQIIGETKEHFDDKEEVLMVINI